MRNGIEDLRSLLFGQLEKLRDAKPDELETETQRSIHMIAVSEVIIDSARAENEFLSLANNNPGSEFIPLSKRKELNNENNNKV